MSHHDLHHQLYTTLRDAGLLEYGSFIEGSVVRELLNIEVPLLGTKEQFDQISLRELAGIDFVRNLLLRDGKYLSGTPGGYKVLLPSENRAQVEAYMAQADRKLRRAQTLLRNMPTGNTAQADQTQARIVMKRDSIRDHHKKGTSQPVTDEAQASAERSVRTRPSGWGTDTRTPASPPAP